MDAWGSNLGYFTSGNGLTDPNCVRVREVAMSGLSERTITDSSLSVVPHIGPGPFVLRTDRYSMHQRS
ncbi:MAG: hypothetical protein IPL52_05455 [Flavobacteriales bacterium]|nr:hypothetical protein [Flavobacteriales bacterium]